MITIKTKNDLLIYLETKDSKLKILINDDTAMNNGLDLDELDMLIKQLILHRNILLIESQKKEL